MSLVAETRGLRVAVCGVELSFLTGVILPPCVCRSGIQQIVLKGGWLDVARAKLLTEHNAVFLSNSVHAFRLHPDEAHCKYSRR
jgi:hypothetical protein